MILIVVTLLFYLKTQTRIIKGEYPVSKIEIYKHRVTVYPSTNTKLEDFVDMSLFYGFNPEMRFENAINLFGEPDNIREERGNIYYEYWEDEARVEVVREEYSTGDNNNPIGVTWALYSYPKDFIYTELLNSKIAEHIDPTMNKTIVLIKNQTRDIDVLIEILGNRVEKMIW